MTALRWLFFIPLAFVASILAGAFAYWFGFMIVRYFDLYTIGEVVA
jgi:ABC-type polysaccharide/polyol phosphate export permease